MKFDCKQMDEIWLQRDKWNFITKWWMEFVCKMMNGIWLQNDEWNLIAKWWMEFYYKRNKIFDYKEMNEIWLHKGE